MGIPTYFAPWRAPGAKFSIVLLLGASLSTIAIHTALRLKEFERPLLVGDVIESPVGSFTISPLDRVAEPSDLTDSDERETFFKRQGNLHRAAEASGLATRSRSIADLGTLFWIPLLVGVGALAISGWIGSLRPRDLAAIAFATSGAALCVACLASAIYTTRPLALPENAFRTLAGLNAFGASIFGSGLIAMFLVYPTRLPGWKSWMIAQSVGFGAWMALYLRALTPPALDVSILVIAETVGIAGAVLAQYLRVRSKPKARAALVWLGLSVTAGAVAFLLLNTIPLLFGRQPVEQGYAIASFLAIYLGIAAGITQYRLFEVERWAFRFLRYATSAALLVLLDAGLVHFFRIDRLPALGSALFLTGLFYIPFRNHLFRRLAREVALDPAEMLAATLHVAFASSPETRAERWRKLLNELFDPLETIEDPSPVPAASIGESGLFLHVPAAENVPALRLGYASSGRKLFTPRSVALVSEILSLVRLAASNRTAYDRGVAEERRRMADDLHDDVGARLLTGLHLADEKLRPTLEGAIADIRAIVNEMSGTRKSTERLLATLRFETKNRLEIAAIALEWRVGAGASALADSGGEKPDSHGEDPDPALRAFTPSAERAIVSAIRETVSNVVRHSGARSMSIEFRFEGAAIRIALSDDGVGIPASVLEGTEGGHGLRILRRRIRSLGGRFEFTSPARGTRLELDIPDAFRIVEAFEPPAANRSG